MQRRWFFKILWCFVAKKVKLKVFARCYETLTKSENPYSNPLQRVCSGFLLPAYGSKQLSLKLAVILKIFPKAAGEMYIFADFSCLLKGEKYGRKLTSSRKESQNWNFDADFASTFRISKNFHREKQNLDIYFSLHQGSLKSQISLRKYWFNYERTSKAGMYIRGTTNVTFLKKIKNTDPSMGAKFKSKTHTKYVFWFFKPFLRVWLQSFQKVLIWQKKFFFDKFKKDIKKCSQN